MHFSLLPTSPPPEPGPRQASLEQGLAWLRDELEGTRPEQKAAIRHELGVLEQLAGRDPTAVREQLASANAWPRFKEPVEHLIVLIERHRSFKNSKTLLEHLLKTADGLAEQVRAHVLRAWCALVHDGDGARASSEIEAALRLDPRDASAALSAEYFARRAERQEQAQSALARRAQLTSDTALRAILQLDLGRALAASGDVAQALAAFSEVEHFAPDYRFAALEEQLRLGERSDRSDGLLAAARARADLIVTALSEPSSSVRVPASFRQPSQAVHALLDLARLERALGAESQAISTLERAERLNAEGFLVRRAQLALAFDSGDADRIEALVPRLLEGCTPEEAAALWTRLSQVRLARNEASLALEALERAISAHPESLAARALELDLLRGVRQDRGRARAHARLAERFGERGARHWILAAHAWSQADAAAEAEDALERAVEAGASRASVLRITHALADFSGDPAWSRRAVRALLQEETSPSHRAGLGLEAWRAARLAGDAEDEARTLEILDSLSETCFVARLVRAYALSPRTDDASGAAALAGLAALESDPSRRLQIEWCRALRLAGGGELAAARALLTRLHSEQPGSAVVAGTLIGVCERSAGAEQVPSVLRATAEQLGEASLSASLFIEAGLRSFRAGAREQAVADFQAAERRANGAAAALLDWAARADDVTSAGSDEPRPRDPLERLLRAVERVVKANPPSASALNELIAASRNPGDGVPEGLVGAARLSALLAARAVGSRADPQLLERLGGTNADCAELCDAFRYLEASAQSEALPKSLEESARRWAASSRESAAALGWLAAAQRLAPRDREVQAWQWLASRETGPVSEAALCNAALSMLLASPQSANVANVPLVAGSSAEVRLTNLETSPPGCDPRRRVLALEGAAELYGEPAAALTSLLRGYNLLALGDNHTAAAAFRHYVDYYPDDPAGWEGLLSAARAGDDPALLAEAAAALGNTSKDPAHAARLLEEAAEIFLEQLHDDTAAAIALTRAVELDVTRRSSVDHLLALLKEAGDAPRILDLVERRLSVCPPPTDPESNAQRASLEWERARAARQLEDLDTAERALQRVLELDPAHSAALALLGEVHLTRGRHADAAGVLARLAMLEHAPAEERVTSGLFAVDLFENHLDDTARAVEVLASLNRAGLTTLAVRERLARAAAKSEAWDDAAAVLEQLMFERSTREERAEAARLALCIHRDRRNDPAAAAAAAQALLAILPGDAEALDWVLGGHLAQPATDALLEAGKRALNEQLLSDPLAPEPLERLCRLARRSGDAVLEQITLGTLFAVGAAPPGARARLEHLEARIVHVPRGAIPAPVFEQARDPAELDALNALVRLISPEASRAFGNGLDTFRLGRRDRVGPSSGSAVYDEIATWVAAFGLAEFELYRSSTSGDRLDVIPSQPLAVIAGMQVATPLGPFQRRELARALFAARSGLGVLSALGESSVVTLLAAAGNLAGVPLDDDPALVDLADFRRRLDRALPRKTRRQLPDLAAALRNSGTPLRAALQSTLSSLDRMSALAVGDPGVVVSPAPWEVPRPTAPDRLQRLVRFMLSPEFTQLQAQLGASVT